MADLAGALSKINDVEVANDANNSEALFAKIGANINELIDSVVAGVQVFNYTGVAQYFTVPVNKRGAIIIEGCGGGGGGGGGWTGFMTGGSSGGNGAAIEQKVVAVTEGDVLTIVIGAGGAGGTERVNGSKGGDSYVTLNGNVVARFVGGAGGLCPVPTDDQPRIGGVSNTNDRGNYTPGGAGGSDGHVGYVGSDNLGTGGSYGTGGNEGGSGGGGACIGNGGNGANGGNGGNGSAGGVGAGGGGGGTGGDDYSGGTGGAGGAGRIVIFY